MWRRCGRLLVRLVVVVGVCLLVAFAPSSAWADTATPTPTDTATTSTGTPTDTASPSSSSPSSSAPASTASPSSTLSPVGSESDPLIVQFPVAWLAVFLLIGALVVFLLAALLVSGWGGS
jgi:hypothetical protein